MTEDTDALPDRLPAAADPAGARAGVPGPAAGLEHADVVTLRDALGMREALIADMSDPARFDALPPDRAGHIRTRLDEYTRAVVKAASTAYGSDVLSLRERVGDFLDSWDLNEREWEEFYSRLDDLIAAVRADATRAAEAEVAGLRAAVVEWSDAADIASCTPGCDDQSAIDREYVAIQRLRSLVGHAHNAPALAAQPAAPEAEPEREHEHRYGFWGQATTPDSDLRWCYECGETQPRGDAQPAAPEAEPERWTLVPGKSDDCPRCGRVKVRVIAPEYEPGGAVCDECGWDSRDTPTPR